MRAFRYEILLMNQLRHPNIVMLMGALWSDKMVGIVLEFAESGSLSDALKSKKISKNWTWQNPKLSIVCDIARTKLTLLSLIVIGLAISFILLVR